VTDNVTQPKHYTSAGIECIDAIEAALGPDGFRAYCIGNVIKYNWRHRLKNGNEDLRKAEVYQAWAAAGTAAEKPEAPEAKQYAPTLADVLRERAEDDDLGLKAGEAITPGGTI